MNRNLRWRTLGLIGIVIVCVLVVTPSVVGPRAVPSWFPVHSTITLGLDLEGGSHIVYGIDLAQAVADRVSTIARDLRIRLGEDGIEATVATPREVIGSLTVEVEDPTRRAEVAASISADHGEFLDPLACPSPEDGTTLCFRASAEAAEQLEQTALTNAVELIRERIDERGIAEPNVVARGDDIIVEMPGLEQELIAQTRSVIARAAKLEFKVVDAGSEYMRRLFAQVGSAGEPPVPTDPRAREAGITAEIDQWRADTGGDVQTDYFLIARDRRAQLSVEEAREIGCIAKQQAVQPATESVGCDLTGRQVIERYVAQLAAADPTFRIPDDRQLAYERVEPPPEAADPRPYWRSYYLDRTVELTGAAIEDVAAAYDPNTAEPLVLLDFTRSGGRTFGELTTRIVGQKLATLLDDRVRSAPVINEPIRGGRASITLGGGAPQRREQEQAELVTVLKTGSLPAPLREESAAEIGPTLGQDAIEKAKIAFALGILIVIALMVGVYRTSGAIALITLTLNVLFVFTLLIVFGATLTLPGIAGIVLAFGMAVDGNIIIYERIREELGRNKSLSRAVDIGYSRAFSAIIDGQLTTMSGGVVLLVYGTGPITGFAVTLIMGNITALFANIWCTRVLYDHYLNHLRARNKPIAI